MDLVRAPRHFSYARRLGLAALSLQGVIQVNGKGVMQTRSASVATHRQNRPLSPAAGFTHHGRSSPIGLLTKPRILNVGTNVGI
jgi:hypothetical protein